MRRSGTQELFGLSDCSPSLPFAISIYKKYGKLLILMYNVSNVLLDLLRRQ